MAFTVLSQHFYSDNLLQCVSMVSTAANFNLAYEDLETYVSEVSNIEGYHAYMSSIEHLTVNKINQFVEIEPHANTSQGFTKGVFMINANFKRTKVT